MHIEIVDWFDPRALALRGSMDVETSAMYAEFTDGLTQVERDALDSALSIDPAAITVTVIALVDEVPVGHAALRPFGTELEVKKVFVAAESRGTPVARALMSWLEEFARERGVASLVLQTGPLQAAAIALYKRIGYAPIPPYGRYADMPGALCYRKALG